MNTTNADTRRRILDAAATLYSQNGVGATSLRAIVKKADVNLNAVNYHFGSKQVVTERLFLEIMTPINEERINLLVAAESDPTPRNLLHAIFWPVFRYAAQSEADRLKIRIVNLVRQDPSCRSIALLEESVKDFAPRFEQLMAKSLGITRQKLRTPLRLVIATAWGFATQTMAIDQLASKKSARVQKRVFEKFLDFVEGGLHAAISSSSP